ncbi:CPBP family glutamic-type intramembrane protease [Corynebacterium sp. H127]|uniref:CPBP family glutamic-type intramembrane protease n=1 Tax=Corynebacterium sp. H127 TaxID=3133418 RepID=UPI0030AC4C18
MIYAFLIGLLLAELVALTRSLWAGIVWHFVYDFTAFLAGDNLTTLGIVLSAIINVLLLGLVVLWWRRLFAPPRFLNAIGHHLATQAFALHATSTGQRKR